MSDRTFSSDVLPLTRPWRRAIVARGLAGSAVVELQGSHSGSLAARGASRRPGVPPGRGLWAALRAAWRRHQTRRCLVELDASALKDIGISYAEAEAEANKPFWVA